MTTLAGHYDAPRSGEGGDLSERISGLFSDRYDRLERLSKAKKVTQDDLAFISESKVRLRELEGRNQEGLDRGSIVFLTQLREILDAADANIDSAELVEGTTKAKEEKKIIRKEVVPDYGDEDGESGDTPDSEPPSGAALVEKYADDENAAPWLEAAKAVDAILDRIQSATDDAEIDAILEEASGEFVPLYEDHKANLQMIRDGGWTFREHYPFMEAVVFEMGRLLHRFKEFGIEFSFEGEEDSGAPQESGENPEKIFADFETEIEVLNGQINTLYDMPLETAQDVAAARETLDIIFENVKGYGDDWRKKVSPILDDLKKRNLRWGPWGPLSKEHQALIRRFFGKKAKNEGDEEYEGVLQMKGREIRDRDRALRAEMWEQDFPEFSLKAAKLAINMQDARMRRGEERKGAFEDIEKSLAELEEQWRVLRTAAPRPDLKERVRGARSPRPQYDAMLRDIRGVLPRLIKRALRARPSPLDEVAYQWRQAMVDTSNLWVDGKKFEEKIKFLKQFASGDVDDAAMNAMIREEERESFLALAESDVLEDLRRRGAVRRERREEIERRERARLYHPKLEVLRLDARDMYRRALNAPFWKEDTQESSRRRLLAEGVVIENADLEQYVTDVHAYRRSYGMVNGAYANAKAVEDTLYVKGEEPSGAVRAPQLRRAIDRYLEAEEREARAWKRAINAEGWKQPIQARRGILHGTFADFWEHGSKVFKQIPPVLREPIVDWVMTRARLRTMGNYAQWMLDQNPEKVQFIKNLPPVFRVQPPEPKEEGEEGGAEEAAELSAADKAELALPLQVERAPEDQGGGAFEELEEGASADVGREEDEAPVGDGASDAGESTGERSLPEPSATGEAAPAAEREGSDREQALEEHAAEIVRRLTE